METIAYKHDVGKDKIKRAVLHGPVEKYNSFKEIADYPVNSEEPNKRWIPLIDNNKKKNLGELLSVGDWCVLSKRELKKEF